MKIQTYLKHVMPIGLALLAAFSLTPVAWAHPKTVQLPAGSVNGLAAAVAQAGAGGTVILESGLHQESGEVLVSFPVAIIGKKGAILETATTPTSSLPFALSAAVHFKNAPGASVRGIWFRPPGTTAGNCAVILEDSSGAQVLDNQMTQLQYGVFVERSDNAVIRRNSISITTDWENGSLLDAEGIISNSGQNVQVTDNQISNGMFGIFASDAFGKLERNTLTGNFYAVFFCHNYNLGDSFYYLFSGNPQFGTQPATSWEVRDNIVHGNAWGFIVTDGSNHNLLFNNDASGNGDPAVWGVLGYDVELTGDTPRWAPDPPVAFASHNNLVIQEENERLVVKDCGTANVVLGKVTRVDTSKDPCY